MMTDNNWKTVRVPPDAYDEAKAQKEAASRTWGEQIVRPEEGDSEISDEVIQDLINRIASQAGDSRIDDDKLARAVAAKLDYGELANQVADELEARRR